MPWAPAATKHGMRRSLSCWRFNPRPSNPNPVPPTATPTLLQRWLEEVLLAGAPAGVKSPQEALLASDVW